MKPENDHPKCDKCKKELQAQREAMERAFKRVEKWFIEIDDKDISSELYILREEMLHEMLKDGGVQRKP